MKAAVYRRYGPPDVVQVEDLPTPVPGDREVLIRVHASTVSSGDWRVRSLKVPRGFGLLARPVFGLFEPRRPVLGTELSGVIEAVGSAVQRFKVGDEVFAFPGFDLGGHAEYRTMPEDGRVVHRPEGLRHEEAAALSFGGTTALHFLRDLGKVQPGEEVLIVGASGAVGSAAVQIARHFGAKVTGVTSTANVELVQALGADRVIDYTTTDFLSGARRYDAVFDTVGSTTIAAARDTLKPTGRLLLCAADLPQMLEAGWVSLRGGRKVLTGNTPERVEDLRWLAELAAAGRYRPLIDRSFPLERIAEAHAYVETGRKRGSVVITMGH